MSGFRNSNCWRKLGRGPKMSHCQPTPNGEIWGTNTFASMSSTLPSSGFCPFVSLWAMQEGSTHLSNSLLKCLKISIMSSNSDPPRTPILHTHTRFPSKHDISLSPSPCGMIYSPLGAFAWKVCPYIPQNTHTGGSDNGEYGETVTSLILNTSS